MPFDAGNGRFGYAGLLGNVGYRQPFGFSQTPDSFSNIHIFTWHCLSPLGEIVRHAAVGLIYQGEENYLPHR
jgi:hypothetical protein